MVADAFGGKTRPQLGGKLLIVLFLPLDTNMCTFHCWTFMRGTEGSTHTYLIHTVRAILKEQPRVPRASSPGAKGKRRGRTQDPCPVSLPRTGQLPCGSFFFFPLHHPNTAACG